MDLVTKSISAAQALVIELDESIFGSFRADAQQLLTQLQTSHINNTALQEKHKALSQELDAARRSLLEVKQEEEDLHNAMKQIQEDSARLQEENQKARLASAHTESSIREVRASISSLESQREAGSGWSAEQLASQQDLRAQKAAALAELEARQKALVIARTEVEALTALVDAAHETKGKADTGITELKDSIAACKTQAALLGRTKEGLDRELKDTQDCAADLRRKLVDESALAASGAQDVATSQEAIKRDKAALDRSLKDYDHLRGRATTLNEEATKQMQANVELAAELNVLSESTAVARTTASRLRREVARLTKLQSLCADQLVALLAKREETEAWHAASARELDDLEASIAAEHKRNEVRRGAAEDAHRERDVLVQGLTRASDRAKAALEVVAWQEGVRRNLQTEIAAFSTTLRRLRDEIESVQQQRQTYTEKCEEATQVYFTVSEGVKLQELQIGALQRKLDEGHGRLKQQQTLYDAVKDDRAAYKKNLAAAYSEIAEMKKSFRGLASSIESIKDEITGKDAALLREHAEHARVESEKTALRNEVARINKQVQSCEHIITNQEAEAGKLHAIIGEADTERQRQKKEFDAVTGERTLLRSQLVKRDAELAILYDKLRLQKSSLATGTYTYKRAVAERDDIASAVAALKGELLVAATQTSDGAALQAEAKRLEADLRAEKTRIRSLMEEMDKPMNIHRWRSLADRDPERWALLQRVHSLQRRLLEARGDVAAKEAAIAEKEATYALLRSRLSRVPDPAAGEQLAAFQASLKSKTKQLRALEAELSVYRTRVDEYKRELARVDEAMAALAQQYIASKLRSTAAARRPRQSTAASVPWSESGAAMASGYADHDMAGPSSRHGSGGPTARLLTAQAAAVKDEADELLEAYAHVLSGPDAASGQESGLGNVDSSFSAEFKTEP